MTFSFVLCFLWVLSLEDQVLLRSEPCPVFWGHVEYNILPCYLGYIIKNKINYDDVGRLELEVPKFFSISKGDLRNLEH